MKLLTAFLMLLFASVATQAQISLKDLFGSSEPNLFYFGIDFSKVKIIDDSNAKTDEIVDKQFGAINDLVVNEPKKYKIAEAFDKTEADHDLSYIAKVNDKTDPDKILSTNTADFKRLTEKDMDAAVKALAAPDQKKVGLLFVVEGVSKAKKAMAVWVVLFDTKSKKVLMTERVEGKMTMAFTFRNQWGAGINSVIEMIEKSKFREWKAKYVK